MPRDMREALRCYLEVRVHHGGQALEVTRQFEQLVFPVVQDRPFAAIDQAMLKDVLRPLVLTQGWRRSSAS
jgi:hypothetical protein